MKTCKLNSLIIAWIFCIGQSFGEAFLGFIFTNVRMASDVNNEGAIFFAVIRICLTLIPYLLVFLIANIISPRIKPSVISFVINLPILIYFYSSGMIQKDPVSFVAGSLLISLILLAIDNKRRIKRYLINREID
ncbi:hypothetical protein GXP67_23235 [Rhodocytophaga rosea]|uniref:Uncharacterized protein n=1 Tax=Rhodocytophaga rosea TaxID=2704465 RepID=A0A6C0GNZ4_9BACT|nr:hypothetical protein [Rhodocytophaga rosea]QHT69343.1 hypothetical protein GXP67_23235 [Rhodocytophaga rosea]